MCQLHWSCLWRAHKNVTMVPFLDKFMRALQSQSVDLPVCSSLQTPPHLGFLCLGGRVCGQLPLIRVWEPRISEPSITLLFLPCLHLLSVCAAQVKGSWVLYLNWCFSTLLKLQLLSGLRPHYAPPWARLRSLSLVDSDPLSRSTWLSDFWRSCLLPAVISWFPEPSIEPMDLWSGIHSPHLPTGFPFITSLQAASCLFTYLLPASWPPLPTCFLWAKVCFLALVWLVQQFCFLWPLPSWSQSGESASNKRWMLRLIPSQKTLSRSQRKGPGHCFSDLISPPKCLSWYVVPSGKEGWWALSLESRILRGVGWAGKGVILKTVNQ